MLKLKIHKFHKILTAQVKVIDCQKLCQFFALPNTSSARHNNDTQLTFVTQKGSKLHNYDEIPVETKNQILLGNL